MLFQVIKDPACGVTKGCFSNCQSTSCSYIVSWRDEGDFGVYTLTAEVALITGAYVVLGFSDDNKMVMVDYCMLCFETGNHASPFCTFLDVFS